MQHYDEGQDQESLYTKASELVVGNEESGQASASSTTTVANAQDDNDADNEDAQSNRAHTSTRSVSSVIPNLRPSSEDSDSDENEANNDGNGNAVRHDENEDPVVVHDGGGGDWFTNVGNNPNEPFSFTDFLVQYFIAGAIAVALLILAEIIEAIFHHPGNVPMFPHKSRRKGMRK